MTDTATGPGRRGAGDIVFAAFGLAWVVVLALYLSHRIVLSSDSINNHVHVWWIARDLWHHGHLPWHFPQLASGRAYAYPYGFTNWTTAALAWPLLGDRAVTLWTALGVLGCIGATFYAFPEVRRGWFGAAVLANSAIVEALLFGQQSFAWGAAGLLFGFAAWRRGRRGWAAVLIGLGQLTHPAIVAPIAVVVIILYLPFTKDRLAVLRWYPVSCLMALPAVWLVFASPTNAEVSSGSRMLNFWITLGPRVLIAVLPIFSALLQRVGWKWLGPVALAVPVIFNLAFEIPLNVTAQWRQLAHHGADTTTLDTYLHSPSFVRGETYRVLRGGDGKLGLYQVVRAGGTLDAELFPESMAIKSFRDLDEYAALLCKRRVDQVLMFDTYDAARHTNEHAMLRQLASSAPARVGVQEVQRADGFTAYAVDHRLCS